LFRSLAGLIQSPGGIRSDNALRVLLVFVHSASTLGKQLSLSKNMEPSELYHRHGPISPCPVAHTELVIQEYLKADLAGRNLLELRYGRHHIHRLVAEYEREQASKQWIRSSTTSCPGCQSNVEKGMGCNHVRKSFPFLYI